METMELLKTYKIDLRTCQRGDILISSHGMRLKYLRPTTELEYLDHVVQYPDNVDDDIEFTNDIENIRTGTRSNDGYVYARKRIPETDHDIVEIIK